MIKINTFKYFFIINLILEVSKIVNILSKYCQEVNSNIQTLLDYASGSVVQLNDLRNNFERFYDQILKDATDRMPSLIKEFHEDLVNNKNAVEKSPPRCR